MPRLFAISTPSETVTLNENGQGEVSFTITNNTNQPLRGQIKLQPQDAIAKDWLSLKGEPGSTPANSSQQVDVRDFTANGTQQVTVNINVPPGTPTGKYSFRIDVASTLNPNEDYTEGPPITMMVEPSEVPPKPFPWWILAVVGVLVVAGGVVAYLLFRPRLVSVPEVINQPVPEALLELEEANLTSTTTEEISTTAAPGTVIAQDPLPFREVPRETEVALTVATAPQTVPVPVVEGMSLQQAVNTLRNAGLSVGTISGNQLDQTVVATVPPAGEPVPLGTLVEIQMPFIWDPFPFPTLLPREYLEPLLIEPQQ